MGLSFFNILSAPQDPQGRLFGTGNLKNGQAYEIRQLSHKNLDEICDLHQAIHAALGKNESTFISHKTREDFAAYINGKGVILGVICEGKLIGMGAILLPTQKNPDTHTADMVQTAPPHKVAVFQSDSVLPEYRGNGLQQKLSIARIAVAKAQGRTQILALADIHNVATIKSFLHIGLSIVGAGVDPDDHGEIYHMRGRIPQPGISLKITL